MNIQLGDSNRLLWLILAVTFPLFSIGFYRVEIFDFNIAIPMLAMGTLISFGLIRYILFHQRVVSGYIGYKFIFALCYLFFILHIHSCIYIEFFGPALEELIKLFLGLACFIAVIKFFPKSESFISKFMVVIFWSSSVLLGIFVYKYLFVFKSAYLGTNLEYNTGSGKNQLSWYLSIFSIFSFFYFFKTRKYLLSVIPLFLLWLSLLYVSSRGAWLTVGAGLLFSIVFTLRQNFVEGIKMGLILLIGLPLVIGVVLFGISLIIDNSMIVDRFLYLFRPSEYWNLHSYEVRLGVILDAFKGFFEAPLLGVGLTNYGTYLDRTTHNDFALILLEQGSLGEIVFLALLVAVSLRIRLFYRFATETPQSWIFLANRCAFIGFLVSLFFINVYTSTHFWIILGLFLVIAEIEKNYSFEEVPSPEEVPEISYLKANPN